MNIWPVFSEEEQNAVLTVLKSGKVNYWTGHEGKLFEQEFAQYIGVKHAIAVANGTLALELCLGTLKIGEGDEVIVTSRTFLASASVIINCGATPVFADVDLNSQNITVETIDAVKTEKTKAIITVHLAGWPCDMPEIMSYAKKNNLWVIEDCAQAHGAAIKGKKVGSFGDMAAFSFCQDKIMTTGGEGGMVTTNDPKWWRQAWSYKDHGKSYDLAHSKVPVSGFRWLHQSFGSNFRMTEMQAAIGRVQLRKVEGWLEKRQKNAAAWRKYLSQLSYLRLPEPPLNYQHAYYKFYAFLKKESELSRDALMDVFSCLSGTCSEVYLEACFNGHPSKPKQRLKNAKELGETSLMFLCDPTIDADAIARSVQVKNKMEAK
jgi:dTDP-4-amino-4,6-dideoxygalactose transaminase